MDRHKIFIEWMTKRLFPISIAIFVLIYIWWFRLTPWDRSMAFWDPPNDCCSNINYRGGLVLLFLYAVSGTLWWLTRNHGCLGVFFRLTTIFFFIITSWGVAVFLPRVIDSAKYNGTMYYLVSYSTWPDRPWTIEQLTKWHGAFNYETHDMDSWAWRGKLFYDNKTNLVNVIAVSYDWSHLLYTDDKPPRSYVHSSVHFKNHVYYISLQCVSEEEDQCILYEHTLHQCELDNTACAMLPFRYFGKEDYAFIEINEETRYIDLYVDDFPAYSYGEYPRCYVDGCEILESAQ